MIMQTRGWCRAWWCLAFLAWQLCWGPCLCKVSALVPLCSTFVGFGAASWHSTRRNPRSGCCVHVDDSCLQEVPSNNITGLVPGGLSVQHVQPARVTQYTRTQLTVVLNDSLCQQLGKVRWLQLAAVIAELRCRSRGWACMHHAGLARSATVSCSALDT
jgi:hypothetical protein